MSAPPPQTNSSAVSSPTLSTPPPQTNSQTTFPKPQQQQQQQQQPQLPLADLNLRLSCRDCKDKVPNIVEDFSAGDLICGNCGLVLGNRIIDTRSEWRTFASDDDSSGDPSRVGAMGDPLLGGNNILEATVISGLDKHSGLSKSLNRANQSLSADKATLHLAAAFKSIETMCHSISLPRVIVDTAKQLFKQVEDDKLVKGKTGEAVKAACIYIACGINHSARTFKEICNLTKCSKKDVGRIYKLLQPKLQQQSSTLSLDAYVYRFSSQLDLSSKVQQAAVKVVKRVSEDGCLAGKSPITVVAACLYFAIRLSDDPKHAKDVADVAQCSESTLKNALRYLMERKDEFGAALKLAREPSDL